VDLHEMGTGHCFADGTLTINLTMASTVQYAKVWLFAACARAIWGKEGGGHSALEIRVLCALPGALPGSGRGADRGRRRQTTPNGISWATQAGVESQGKHNVWVKALGTPGQQTYMPRNVIGNLPPVGGACGSNRCGMSSPVGMRGRSGCGG
jgi:hypothetical protein